MMGGKHNGIDPHQARWERLLAGKPAVDPNAPTFLKRLWNFSGTPWATVIAVGLLMYALSRWQSVLSPVWPSNAPTCNSGAPDTALALVIRRGSSLAVIKPDAILPTDRQLGAAYYAYRSRSVDSGVGAIEREVQGVILSGTGIDPADQPAIRALYITYLGTLPDPYWATVASSLSAGDSRHHIVRAGPFGYFIIILACFAACFRSLAWIPPLLRHVARKADDAVLTPEERRWKKLHNRECPDCGYSLTGLSDNRCPECGGTWKSTELSAWERRLQTLQTR